MMAGISAAMPAAGASRPPPTAAPSDPATPAFELCADVVADGADSACVSEEAPATEAVEGADAPDANSLAGLLSMLGLVPPPSAAASPVSPGTAAIAGFSGDAAAPEQPLAAALPAVAETPVLVDAAVAATVTVVADTGTAAGPTDVPVVMPLPVSPNPQAAAMAAPPPPAVASSPAVPQSLSLQDPDFGGQVGERVMLSFDTGLSEASIELHPSELGPIHIRIENRGDRSNVLFEAAHPATRELLTATLPQLREMLNGQGVEMGRSQVGTLAERRGQDARVTPEQRRDEPPPRRRQWRVGLVDHYA